MKTYARYSGNFLRISLFAFSVAVASVHAGPVQAQEPPAKIVAVIHCDYPPVTFWDKNTDSPAGFFVDVMKSVAERAGLQVTYICRNGWQEMMTAVVDGDADISVLLKSEEREKKVLFTAPIDVTYLSYFARSQSAVDENRDPQGYTVGVIRGSMSFEQLKNKPGLKLLTVASYQDGIFSLLAGEIGLFAGEESMILKRARETGLDNRIKKVGKPFVERERGITLRKSDTALCARLNKVLGDFVGQPDYQRIYLKWYGAPTPYWTTWKLLIAGGTALFLTVCSMAIWRYRSISRINRELVTSIAERRQVQEELQKNEKRLSDILENVGANIFIKDTRYRYMYVNRKACELFGRTAQEIVGNGDDKFFPSESVRKSLDSDRRVIEHGETTAHEETGIGSPDGLLRTYWTVNIPLRDHTGDIYGLCGISTDISDRKRAEEALRRSEEMMRNVLDSVDEGFIAVDRNYQILTANRAYCEQVNTSCIDIVGKHCYETSHKRSRPCFEAGEDCAVRRVIESGEPHTSYHKHTDAEGNLLYVETKAFPLKNKSGVVTSVIESINNITEKHLLEEERLKSQKLEAIGMLAGGIAHDFNNLLQGVFGYISLARLKRDDRERSIEALEEAEKALHLTVKLTNQLLTFSKGGKPVMKPIDLRPILVNAAKFALSGSRSQYRIVVDDLWQTEGDEGQIGQVIQNIVLNADQAMPEGGQVRISARNIEAPGKDIPQALAPGKYVAITIQDSGIGIPEQYIAKIFDPYFTTKVKGSGLGLATSYSIIKNHYGSIAVKSEVGSGTIFFIYLPATTAKPEARIDSAGTIVAGRNGRILIMDDEKVVRDVAGELVRALGHSVEFAAHGGEAIERYQAARQSGRPFDVVILDLTIRGGMGGSETVRKLVEIDPAVRAVVSSGYSDDPVASSYEEQGFKAFLRKPYNIGDLQGVLSKMLG